MSREDLLLSLQTAFDDPACERWGEILQERVLVIAARFEREDRAALVEVLSEWLRRRSEPHSILAMHVAAELGLTELGYLILALRQDVIDGRAFLPCYLVWVDKALERLQ